eukprot:jgi/Bigna1/141233/aug1.61_g15941
MSVNLPHGLNRFTPLHVAAYREQVGAVQCLIDLGADLAIEDKSGRCAVDMAMRGYSTHRLLAKETQKMEDAKVDWKGRHDTVIEMLSDKTKELKSEKKRYEVLEENLSQTEVYLKKTTSERNKFEDALEMEIRINEELKLRLDQERKDRVQGEAEMKKARALIEKQRRKLLAYKDEALKLRALGQYLKSSADETKNLIAKAEEMKGVLTLEAESLRRSNAKLRSDLEEKSAQISQLRLSAQTARSELELQKRKNQKLRRYKKKRHKQKEEIQTWAKDVVRNISKRPAQAAVRDGPDSKNGEPTESSKDDAPDVASGGRNSALLGEEPKAPAEEDNLAADDEDKDSAKNGASIEEEPKASLQEDKLAAEEEDKEERGARNGAPIQEEPKASVEEDGPRITTQDQENEGQNELKSNPRKEPINDNGRNSLGVRRRRRRRGRRPGAVDSKSSSSRRPHADAKRSQQHRRPRGGRMLFSFPSSRMGEIKEEEDEGERMERSPLLSAADESTPQGEGIPRNQESAGRKGSSDDSGDDSSSESSSEGFDKLNEEFKHAYMREQERARITLSVGGEHVVHIGQEEKREEETDEKNSFHIDSDDPDPESSIFAICGDTANARQFEQRILYRCEP